MHKNNDQFQDLSLNFKANSVCVLPWIHFFADFRNDISLCCHAKSPIHLGRNKSIEEIRNSIEYENIRKEMLNGFKPSSCQDCFRKEDLGIESERIIANKQHLDLYHDILSKNLAQPYPLHSLDIRFSNRCNFACAMCDEKYSTKIGLLNGNYLEWELDSLWEEEILKNIHEVNFIYVAGGEPLLEKRLIDFLAKIPTEARENILLTFETNLSLPEKQLESLLLLFGTFKKIGFGISLDAIKEPGELIRKGLKFDHLVKNVDLILNSKFRVKFDCHIYVTISILNILHYFDLVSFVAHKWGDKVFIRNNFLKDPSFLSILILPKKTVSVLKKDLWLKLLSNDEAIKKFDFQIVEVIKYLDTISKPNDYSALRDYLHTRSSLTGLDYFSLVKDLDLF